MANHQDIVKHTEIQQARSVNSFALLKRALVYFLPYKKQIFFAVLAMLCAGGCSAATAWLVKPALDEIFINKSATALKWIPIAFIAVTAVDASSRLIQNYLMHYSGLGVLEKLRDELYAKIIRLPLRFYEGTQIGMLMSRIINDVTMIRSSLPAIIMMTRQLITIGSLIGVVFYQNAALAFWAIIVLPVAFFPFVYFGKRMRKLSRKNQSKLSDVSTLLQEILSGVRVVKAFGTEETEQKRFDTENKRLLKIALKQALAGDFSSSSMELIGAVGIGLVIWFGGMQVVSGEMTPGTFFSFVTAIALLYDPIKKITSANNDIQKALAGAERVFEILDHPEIVEEKSGTKKFAEPFSELRFSNVSFYYQDGTKALDNVSFSVKAGERLAIVGPSGAGKTTFVNLIPRFYDVQEGQVLINNTPIEEYELYSLRQSISLVSQDNFLFNLPVDENIAYGSPQATEADIIAAAQAAFAHDFITGMPGGYKTVIGERGVKLSGGQKQRLTIARALVKDAPLLILDEATSALDSESEKVVQKALENLMQNRTSIVIAHRLATIINADKILVMECGRLVAQGSHAELLETSPLYTKLYNMQFSPEKTDSPENCCSSMPKNTQAYKGKA